MNYELGLVFRTDGAEARFGAFERGARGANKELDRTQERLDRASRASRSYGTSQDRATKSVDRTTRSVRKQTSSTDRATKSTDRAAKSTNRWSQSQSKLGQSLGRSIRSIALVTGGVLTLAGALGQIQSSIGVFEGFEARMAAVQAVSGASEKQFARLETQVRDLGRTTVFSATQAAEAQENLARAGFAVDENLSALPATLDLAYAGELNLATAADIAAGTLRGFQIDASKTSEVVDVLATTAAISNTRVEEMGEGLKFAAPTAQSLGITLKDTSAAMAVLADNMLKGTLGGTGLRQSLVAIINPSGKAKDILSDLGITAEEFRTTIAEKGLIPALELLISRTSGITEAVQLAGSRGGTALQILLSNLDRLGDKRQKLEDVTGAAERMSAIRMDTVAGDMAELRSVVESLKIDFGEGLAPALRGALDRLTEFFGGGAQGALLFGREVGTAIAVAAEVFIFFAEQVDLAKVALQAFILVKLLQFLTLFVAWLIKTAAGLGAYTKAVGTAATGTLGLAAAQTAATGTTNALGVATARTLPIFGAQGQVISTVTAQTSGLAGAQLAQAGSSGAATTASSKFLSLGLTPLTVGLGALLFGVLSANNAVKDMAETFDREIAAIVKSSEDLKDAVDGIAESTDGLLDATKQDIAVGIALLKAGIKPGDKENSSAIRAQVAADFQRKRVDLLVLEQASLEELRAEQAKHRADMEAEIARLPELEKRRDAAQKALQASLRSSREGAGGRQSGEFGQAGRELETARAKIDEYQNAANEANIKINALESSVDLLGAASEEYASSQEGANQKLTEGSKRVDDAAKKYTKLHGELELDITSLNSLADAYQKNDNSHGAVLDKLDRDSRLRQISIDLTATQRTEIARLIDLQVEAEKRATGAQTISELEAQLLAQRELTAAYAESDAAVAATEERLAREAQARDLVSNALDGQKDTIEELLFLISKEPQDQAFGKTARAIADEVAELEKLKTAYGQGALAVALVNQELEIEREVLQATEGLHGKNREEIEAQARARAVLRAEVEALAGPQALGAELSATLALLGAWQDGRVAVEALAVAQKIYNEVVSQGALGNATLIDQISDLILAQAQLESAIGAVERRAELTEEVWDNFLQSFQSSLADGISGILDGGIDSFEDFFDSITDLFIDLIAEWVSEMATAEFVATIGLGSSGGLSAHANGDEFNDAVKKASATMLASSEASGAAVAAGGTVSGGAVATGGGVSAAEIAAGGGVAAGEMATGGGVAGSEMATGGAAAAKELIAGAKIAASQISSSGSTGGGGLFSGGGGLAALAPFAVAIGGYFFSQQQQERRASQRISAGASTGGSTQGLTSSNRDFSEFTSQEVRELTAALNEAVRDTLDSMGALAGEIPQIGVSVRADGNAFIASVGGIALGAFDTFEEALRVSIQSGFQAGSFEGLGENVRNALMTTTASTLEEWQEQLADALTLDRSAMSDFEIAAQEIEIWFRRLRDEGREINASAASEFALLVKELEELAGNISTPDDLRAYTELLGRVEAARASEMDEVSAMIAWLEEFGEAAGGDGAAGGARQLTNETTLLEEHLRKAADASGTAAQAMAYSANLAGLSLDDLRQRLLDLAAVELPDAPTSVPSSGGGNRARDRENLQDELTSIERSELGDLDQELLQLNDRFAEMRSEAGRLGVSLERVAAAQRIELEALQQRLVLDPLSDYLGEVFGNSDFQNEAAGIRDRFNEIREANEALVAQEDDLFVARWRINIAERRALEELSEQVIQSLGLPMEQAAERVGRWREALEFLQEQLDDGVISAERFGDVLAQSMAMAASELYSLTVSILDQMGASKESAEFRALLEEANFHLQVAQLNFLYNQYLGLGLLSDDVAASLATALAFINDPANWPDFSAIIAPPPPPPPPSSNVGSGSDADSVQDRIDAQIKAWNRLPLGDVTKQALALTDQLADLRDAALEAGLPVSGLNAAFQVAVRSFIDDALQPFEDLNLSPLESELKGISDQFDDIRAAFHEIGATAADWERLEAAQAAALEDFWKRATEPLQGLLDELRGNDPRVSSEQRFLDSQGEFRDLLARAQAGDLAAVEELEAAARLYSQEAGAFLGGGVGSQTILDEIMGSLEGVIGSNPFLDGKVPDDPGVRETKKSNDLLEGILLALGGEIKTSSETEPVTTVLDFAARSRIDRATAAGYRDGSQRVQRDARAAREPAGMKARGARSAAEQRRMDRSVSRIATAVERNSEHVKVAVQAASYASALVPVLLDSGSQNSQQEELISLLRQDLQGKSREEARSRQEDLLSQRTIALDQSSQRERMIAALAALAEGNGDLFNEIMRKRPKVGGLGE